MEPIQRRSSQTNMSDKRKTDAPETFSRLPHEMIIKIFEGLDNFRDLEDLSSSNTLIRQIGQDETIWNEAAKVMFLNHSSEEEKSAKEKVKEDVEKLKKKYKNSKLVRTKKRFRNPASIRNFKIEMFGYLLPSFPEWADIDDLVLEASKESAQNFQKASNRLKNSKLLS